MSMKKMIVEFREFQCKRIREKFKLKKVAKFEHLIIQIGEREPIVDVTVRINVGYNIQFAAPCGFRHFLEDEDFVSYDEDMGVPGSILLLLNQPQENIIVQFNATNGIMLQMQMTNFVTVLRAFLQLSNEEGQSDTGRSTLS